MKNLFFAAVLFLSTALSLHSQVFTRSELPTKVKDPWEITYGPDNFLWVTDSGGAVSRIDPYDGSKLLVYRAQDYSSGSPLEKLQACFNPNIGTGTFGLALHPEFLNPETAYIYFVYSYKSGTEAAPATKFKLKRLKWDVNTLSVVQDTDLVTMISSGYDHLGGRLLIVKQNNIPYLFLSIGDHGVSETNSPTCYSPQSTNPNNAAQDPTTQNGKILRFNMDGSIPSDNPLPGYSFYTRGHRNPQGLMYNPNLDIIYDVEHGDRSDDEINILQKGMNYGWKFVRGFHNDNNFPGEAEYVANYVPNPNIANDALIEPLYSFCASSNQDTSSDFLEWCTVAPSDGIYYGSTGIPEWTNSLLVVTLKNGLETDMEVYQFKLQQDGKLVPATTEKPNPKKYFANDQLLNGRLRDIAVSPDGRRIFLVNNSGNDRDKITVYTYDSLASGVEEYPVDENFSMYPNPTMDFSTINYTLTSPKNISIKAYNLLGEEVASAQDGIQNEGQHSVKLETGTIPAGIYVVRFKVESNVRYQKLVITR